jgi:tRNA (guanine-N7-)-methyltransferase
MKRTKHIKQNEVRDLPNVFHSKQEHLEESVKEYFGNANLFTLELGCGNGEYSNTLALKYPGRNFVGIDRAGARIWSASKNSLKLNLTNTAFVITYVEKLEEVFSVHTIEEIWLPFPNPLPHRRKMKKILTNPFFLRMYNRLLIPGGKIHLKTDDDFLFDYTLSVIRQNELNILFATDNLLNGPGAPEEALILTRFEQDHTASGRTTKYISFAF